MFENFDANTEDTSNGEQVAEHLALKISSGVLNL
jgi:hypothetical protein